MTAIGDPTVIALAAMALGFGVIALVLIAMFRNRDIKAKLGTMELVLGSVHEAVNDRPKDGPTLSKQVATMAEHIETIDAKVTTLATALADHILANPGLPDDRPRGPGRTRYGQ